MTDIAGAFPVLPTIFDDAGRIDIRGMANVVEWVIGCGSDGVVFPGLASEYDLLDLDERLAMIALIGERAAGRVAFVAGCSGASDQESAALIAAAERAGAAAAMIVTPARKGDDLDAIGDFYAGLADAASVPVMLQNAPRPMGLGLSTRQLVQVIERAPNIAYVKEENAPCGQRITLLREAGVPQLRAIFGGAGGRYITDELARGAEGTMPASEIADLHVRLIAAHRAGDLATVRMLFERTLPLLNMQAVFRWRLTKEVLRRRGLIESAYVRAPGPQLDRYDLAELDQLLAALEPLIREMGSSLDLRQTV
ncbi:dihydrodipicolinate synthase family protein [Sphingomonas sp.]|uniref:dihydrodipicolinate synthase family protein n=1 Tax=Sphingomonas sp. TaxID=28214 RepID=UPI003BAD2DD3